MIKFHPTNQTLVSFAEGLIAPNESLLVSAHCDMCKQCASKLSSITLTLAEDAFSGDSNTANIIDNELGNMLDAIVSRPSAACKTKHRPVTEHIKLNGAQFKVPQSLQRFATHMGEWSHIVGKLWQAPVAIGGKNLAHFIYMEKGGGVPEHTHIGNELTLVIDGRFTDGINHYDTGDYIALNHENTHTPMATEGEGCLVFSVIDQPLQFTSGWARLINPLSHLYFKVSTKT